MRTSPPQETSKIPSASSLQNKTSTSDTIFQNSDLVFLILQYLNKPWVLYMRLNSVSKTWRAAVSMLVRTPLTPNAPLQLRRSDDSREMPDSYAFYLHSRFLDEPSSLCNRFLPAVFSEAGFSHRIAELDGKLLHLARYGSRMEVLVIHRYVANSNTVIDLRHLQKLREIRFEGSPIHMLQDSAPNTFASLLLPPTVQCVRLVGTQRGTDTITTYRRIISTLPSLLEFSMNFQYDKYIFEAIWRRESCDTPWQELERIEDIWNSSVHCIACTHQICSLPPLLCEERFVPVNQRIKKLGPPLPAAREVAQMLARDELPMLNELFLPYLNRFSSKMYIDDLASLVKQAIDRGIRVSPYPGYQSTDRGSLFRYYKRALHAFISEQDSRSPNQDLTQLFKILLPVMNDQSEHVIGESQDDEDYLLTLRCARIKSLAVTKPLKQLSLLLRRFARSLEEYLDYSNNKLPLNILVLSRLQLLDVASPKIKKLPTKSQHPYMNISILHFHDRITDLSHLIGVLDALHLRFPALHELRIDLQPILPSIANYIRHKYRRFLQPLGQEAVSRECTMTKLRASATAISTLNIEHPSSFKEDDEARIRDVLRCEIANMLHKSYGRPIRVRYLSASREYKSDSGWRFKC